MPEGFEGQPAEQPSSDNSFEGVTSEIEKIRADGVEKIMNEGFPHAGEPGAEQYYQIWNNVDAYVVAVQSDSTLDETLHRYLQDPDNARAFNAVVGDLKMGQAPADFIAAEEGRPPDLHRLSALIAFDGVAKAAIQTEGGKRRTAAEKLQDKDLTGAEGEAARRFVRVAEILDVESNAIMITSDNNPLDLKEVGADYAERFDTFAGRRDVPEIYRERAREMATNLRIDAMRETPEASAKPSLGTEENPYEAEAVSEPTAEKVAAPEAPPVKAIFGQEGVIKPEDVAGIKNRMEQMMQEATPKNAYELSKLLADCKRAGIGLTGGKEKVTKFLEGQRAAMQEKGPRALAQYLAYCRYTGLGGEATAQEQQWLMQAVQERVNDPQHTGLSRLAMNVNYLKVEGYSPDLVRQAVREEITGLRAAGNFDAALQEAARARMAGVEVNDLLVRTDTKFVDEIDRRSQELAANNQWDKFARLRTSADIVWQHVDLGINNKTGLIKYFDQARFLAQGRDTWGAYAEYSADVRELSTRDERLHNAPTVQEQAQWVEEELKTVDPNDPRVWQRENIQEEEARRRQMSPEEAFRQQQAQEKRAKEADFDAKVGRFMDAATPPVMQAERDKIQAEEARRRAEQPQPIFREIPQSSVPTSFFGRVRGFFGRLFGGGSFRTETVAAEREQILESVRLAAEEKARRAREELQGPPVDTAA